jgi:hypothetical protein
MWVLTISTATAAVFGPFDMAVANIFHAVPAPPYPHRYLLTKP